MTEQEKMLAGKIYDPSDKTLTELRIKGHRLSKLYNDTFDTEEEKRKEILEVLGKKMAAKALKTGRNCSLEPMNPYERRIIHSSLQNDRYVTTYSEGEEPHRNVVIALKEKKKTAE